MAMQVQAKEALQITCAIAKKCHPFYEHIRKKTDDYLIQLLGEEASKPVVAMDVPALQCFFYPNGDEERVFHIVLWTLWIIYFDDITISRSDEAYIQKFVDMHKDIMKGGSPPNGNVSGKEAQCLQIFSDTWKCIFSHTSSPGHQIEAQNDFFESACQEVNIQRRKQHGLPTLSELIELRTRTGVGLAFIAHEEYVLQVKVKDDLWHSDDMRELFKMISLQLSLVNDFFSAYKERASGDYMNIPSFIILKEGIGLTEALKKVSKMAEEIEYKSMCFIDQMMANSAQDEGFVKFLSNVKYLISGHFHWYFATKKYNYGRISFNISVLGDSARVEMIPSWDNEMEFSKWC